MSVAGSSVGMRHDMDAAMMASRNNAASVTPSQMKKIRETAQNFEAVFLGEMLRPMFENIDPAEPFGGGAGSDVWKDMQVDEFGKAIAKKGGIGLADHIVRAMLQMQEKK